ncbi:MAG TPA: hypothetical protein VNT26_17580, partial [Candidatus Sulfotelmatobacter sp.]|nr:hypothetical protein [Candidatus Sulfotelmatobacter sp.]
MKTQSLAPHEAHTKDMPVAGPQVPYARQFPIGAEVVPGGGVHFRVWAPKSQRVALRVASDPALHGLDLEEVELEAEHFGYFSVYVPEAEPGMFYKFQLQDGLFPDPASRFQPEGPHGASEIVDSGLFKWADTRWPGVRRQGQVIYEMHVGTFTPEGTWAGAMEQLPELAELGITVIELMPVAEFPGRFGWGYDGVDLFAPTHLYGIP